MALPSYSGEESRDDKWLSHVVSCLSPIFMLVLWRQRYMVSLLIGGREKRGNYAFLCQARYAVMSLTSESNAICVTMAVTASANRLHHFVSRVLLALFLYLW
jgi:hypothetical protein